MLRDAFHDLLPPPIDRRAARWFGVPLDAWFPQKLVTTCTICCWRRRAVPHVLSPPFVKAHRAPSGGQANLGQQLWSIMTFEVWLRRLPEWTRR